tara:strand:+ start:171 stop:758 length:588 start_codon:yes stop_codon:yes gene_type:complete
MGKITNITLAILITGFLVGDAYGEDEILYAWDDEKAKSLGVPLVPVDTVIMCESELRTGFDWENGTYRKSTYKREKHILKKVEPYGGCFGFKFNPHLNYLLTTYGSRRVCIKHHVFGEEPDIKGGECSESYKKREGGTWNITISCEKGIFTPEIRLSPNGFYHRSSLHNDVSSKPENNYKDSQYIEWGKCATISP